MSSNPTVNVKRAERAYDQQPALFRLMAERTPGVVWATDRNLRFTASFGAGLADLNLQPSEVIGMSVADYLRVEDGEHPAMEAHRRALRGEAVEYEATWSGRQYQIRMEPLHEGTEIIGCVGFAHDVTEWRQAEDALRRSHDALGKTVRQRTAELQDVSSALQQQVQQTQGVEQSLRHSEARYKALVDSSPDAIAMCDLQGLVTFASQRAVERHGYEAADELMGRPATDFVVPADRPRMRDNITSLVRQGVRRNDEYECLCKDGSTFFAEVSGALIRDERGEPIAMMGVFRDISERKQAEQALAEERHSLRRMLQAGDRDRQLITYEIHDGIAQRLLGALMQFEACGRIESLASADAQAAFEGGLQALREASAEARSLMNRTRTPVLEKFGVAAAIADFVDQWDGRPGGQEITYRCDVRFGRLAALLENAILRVAQEAIINACVHSRSKLVRVTLEQTGDDVVIEVQDWGTGFDVRAIGDESYGLMGIRERARVLGKGLKIESSPDEGTKIRATFPVIDPSQ